MTRLSPTRRAFLRAMGAGMAALPFSRLLENSVAQAAGEMLPLKFITIYHPHGLSAEFWAMKDSDTETNFALSYAKAGQPPPKVDCSLQPFDDAVTYGKSFKDKLLVIEGIDHLSNANGHDSAGTILTGSTIDGSKRPANSSLDQYLAVTKGLGRDTRITSVNLGVGNDSTESGFTLSYGDGGAPLPKIINPVAAFHLLFDGLAVSSDPAAMAAAERKRKLGQSVVDYVRWDVTRLRGGLAAAEQQKLDQHLSALTDLEKQLGGGMMAGGPVCAVPTMPDASKFPKLKQYNGGEQYFDAITDAHIDMLAQALACDVTRFGTLFMNDLSYTGNPLGLPLDNHGAVAHTYNASTVGNNGVSQPGLSETWEPLAKFNRYCYSKVARLMQKLDQLGILDSTIIYVTSDMGNPSLHSKRNVPTVLAGGANGKFKMGRRLKTGSDCPSSDLYCEDKNAGNYTPTSNSKILVSIAQAFDQDVNTFGTQPIKANVTGALSAMMA